ncbi:MAG: hypothetical protein HYU36_25380 [Planctomycetes bacterium]|nr:hypothetical protein [Planctomycetota bacterium]
MEVASVRHKLVTFFLHDVHEKLKGSYGNPSSNLLFGVTEHLEDYMEAGWHVRDFKVLGGPGGCLSGWVVVLLEMPQPQGGAQPKPETGKILPQPGES